jgi:hypothetical protein
MSMTSDLGTLAHIQRHRLVVVCHIPNLLTANVVFATELGVRDT